MMKSCELMLLTYHCQSLHIFWLQICDIFVEPKLSKRKCGGRNRRVQEQLVGVLRTLG